MDIFTKKLFSEIKVLSVFEQELNDEISGRAFGVLNDVNMLEERINSFIEQEDEEEYKQLLRNRLGLLKIFTADVERLEEDTLSNILTFEEWSLKFGQVEKEVEYDDEVRILLRNYGEYESDILNNYDSSLNNIINDLQKKWESLGELRYEIAFEDFRCPSIESVITIYSKFMGEAKNDAVYDEATEILKGVKNNIDLLYLFLWLRREVIKYGGIRGFDDVKANFGWDALKTKHYVNQLLLLGLLEEKADSDRGGLSYGKSIQDVYTSEIEEIYDRVEKEYYSGNYPDPIENLIHRISFALNEIDVLNQITMKFRNEQDSAEKKALLEARLKKIENVNSKMLKLKDSMNTRILSYSSWLEKFNHIPDSNVGEAELKDNYNKFVSKKVGAVEKDILGLLNLLYVWPVKDKLVTFNELIKNELLN